MKKKFVRTVFAALCLLTAAGFTACIPAASGPEHPQADMTKLIINQVYGRGIEGSDILTDSPVSHSFVELYYSGGAAASLDGYSLYCGYNTGGGAGSGSRWNGHLRLTGTVKPYHSFLVAVSQATPATGARYKITDDAIDQIWPGTAFSTGGAGDKPRIGFNNKNLKILLLKSTDPLHPQNAPKNPFRFNGEKFPGYVDMMSMTANDYLLEYERDPVDAYEGAEQGNAEHNSVASQSRNKAMRRKNFIDTDDSFADIRAVDYRARHLSGEGLEKVRPRALKDGAWGEGNGFDTRPGHVIINQIYGKSTETESALSNSFIELYNPLNAPVSLEGKSLQISSGGTAWEKLVFGAEDVIPKNSSFLVVFRDHRIVPAMPRNTIDIALADKIWEGAALPNQNLKVALMATAGTLTVVNPSADSAVKADCIDFIGVSGSNTDAADGIDAWEGSATKTGLSKQKSFRRKFFIDTDNNMDDFELVDFREYDGDADDGITGERLFDPLLGVWPKSRADLSWGDVIQ